MRGFALKLVNINLFILVKGKSNGAMRPDRQHPFWYLYWQFRSSIVADTVYSNIT